MNAIRFFRVAAAMCCTEKTIGCTEMLIKSQESQCSYAFGPDRANVFGAIEKKDGTAINGRG
jgi:hypothetical protein